MNISRHKRGRRAVLTGEHPAGDAGQIILFCLFAVIWVADAFFLNYSTQLNQYVPFMFRFVPGVMLLIVSLYLVKAGHEIVFEGRGGNTGVIRHGVFGMVRHPIYLSEILFYLGLIIFKISLAALMVWFVTIAFLHYISRFEEKLLLARFGNDYAAYMHEVPMWIPRISKR